MNFPPTVQIPVLKSGSVKKAQWSTRVLTVDVATNTVTISRRHHPSNVLYHSLRVHRVQMWPRYAQPLIANNVRLMEAKLTLRIEGEAVPVPRLTPELPSTDVRVPASAGTAATYGDPTPSAAPQAFLLTVGNGGRQHRLLTSSMNWFGGEWMVRFTTFEAYTLALQLLTSMRNKEGVKLREVSVHAAEDLERIETAWLRESQTVANDTAAVGNGVEA